MSRSHLIVAALATVANIGSAQVAYERLLRAADEQQSWLTYSGSYRSQRYSTLQQITAANVDKLRPVWIHQQLETIDHSESTPIVADGVMYVTEAMSAVTALDLRTGRTLWRYAPTLPPRVRFVGFPRTNRGVAILDSTLFVGTLAAHLVALDARSGAVRWDVALGDNAQGYAITSAPLALRGKVLIGVSGGEMGIRGFVDCYDAATGRRLWRFYTIPAAGESGNETWGGDSWKTGGAPTWLTGSFDPDLNLVYWGVGNPAPDWNGDARPGANLYSNSLIALDPDSGRLRWHFQFTPHDTHDWDANQIPVLVDARIDGRDRKLVATANRNGFYYVLDRVNGAFVAGTAFVKQTWARGLDAKGSPMLVPGMVPSDSGTLTYPSMYGATNWNSPTFSPQTGLFYVVAREQGSIYYKREAEYQPGEPFTGGGQRLLESDHGYGAVRALDLLTGARRWEFRLLTPTWAGLLSTASGLVFGGSTEGWFYAVDARTGKLLWRFQTGAPITASPITFMYGGRQHVAITVRRTVFVFALP